MGTPENAQGFEGEILSSSNNDKEVVGYVIGQEIPLLAHGSNRTDTIVCGTSYM